tara:strand:+ start:993 stop:1940 length:948 start_codon:yes stop_codon:yes gene_type:complete
MTFYDILNIDENASQDEIKKQFRNQQLKYHPDKNTVHGDDMYNKILEAYNVLSNKELRDEYDSKVKNPLTISKYNNNNNSSSSSSENLLETVISKMFSGNNNSSNKDSILSHLLDETIDVLQKGELNVQFDYNVSDIVKEIKLTYEEAYSGCVKNIVVKREINYICGDKKSQKSYEEENIYVTIPRGVDNNELIIVKGKGDVYGKVHGDLKVKIILMNHEVFEREGLNLVINKKVDIKDILSGINLQIYHLNKKKYTFSTENRIIQPGSIEEIAELGFVRDDVKIKGSLLLKFNIKIPENLTIEQRRDICKILAK